jgi:hypothetical protein
LRKTKPRTPQKLAAALASVFNKAGPDDIKQLIASLGAMGIVMFDGTRVTYHLPDEEDSVRNGGAIASGASRS